MIHQTHNYGLKVGLLIFLGLFGLLSLMAILKYLSLHSTFFDLGIFLNNFTNITSDQGWRLYFGHFQPLMLIYSWINELIPAGSIPVVILALQGAVLTWPVVFLYHRFGTTPAVAFALYFPLWYSALFDFHMDHLSVPLLFGFFFMEKNGRIGWAVVLALLLALVKEPFALQTAACGIYLVLARKHPFLGIVLIGFGLSYFYFATRYLIPYFTPETQIGLGSSAFSWLGNSLTDIIWFIVTKPHIVLGEIFSDNGKIRYLIYIFGALTFIPLLRPGILIVALPIMAIALLSKVENHSGLYYHYTAGLIAPLTMAFAEGLPIARKLWAKASLPITWFTPLLLIILFAFHVKMAPSPISVLFWNQKSWAYNANAYLPTNRDSMIKNAIHTHISSNQNVAISAQNTLNWGYLAQRKYYFFFPLGVLKPHIVPKGSDRSLVGLWKFINTGEMTTTKTEGIWADYVVLDLKRPWFIEDKGCHWKYGQCKSNGEFSSRFLALVQQTKEHFDTVFQEDGLYILKRGKN
jgi:uncharacterized membrane protein